MCSQLETPIQRARGAEGRAAVLWNPMVLYRLHPKGFFFLPCDVGYPTQARQACVVITVTPMSSSSCTPCSYTLEVASCLFFVCCIFLLYNSSERRDSCLQDGQRGPSSVYQVSRRSTIRALVLMS